MWQRINNDSSYHSAKWRDTHTHNFLGGFPRVYCEIQFVKRTKKLTASPSTCFVIQFFFFFTLWIFQCLFYFIVVCSLELPWACMRRTSGFPFTGSIEIAKRIFGSLSDFGWNRFSFPNLFVQARATECRTGITCSLYAQTFFIDNVITLTNFSHFSMLVILHLHLRILQIRHVATVCEWSREGGGNVCARVCAYELSFTFKMLNYSFVFGSLSLHFVHPRNIAGTLTFIPKRCKKSIFSRPNQCRIGARKSYTTRVKW